MKITHHREVWEWLLALHLKAELLLYDVNTGALYVANKVGVNAKAITLEQIFDIQFKRLPDTLLQVSVHFIEKKGDFPPAHDILIDLELHRIRELLLWCNHHQCRNIVRHGLAAGNINRGNIILLVDKLLCLAHFSERRLPLAGQKSDLLARTRDEPLDRGGDVVFQAVDVLNNRDNLALVFIQENQSHIRTHHFKLVFFHYLHLRLSNALLLGILFSGLTAWIDELVLEIAIGICAKFIQHIQHCPAVIVVW